MHLWTQYHHSLYNQTWSITDRLEFALRKVDLARWEHERVQRKLIMLASKEPEKPSHDIEYFKSRLREGLIKLGLPEERVENIIAFCQGQLGQRCGKKLVEGKYSVLPEPKWS